MTAVHEPSTVGLPVPRAPKRRRGRRIVVPGAVLAVVVAGGALVVTDPFGGSGGSAEGASAGVRTALEEVTQRTLTAQTQVSATLGYAGSYSVVNNARGTVTGLPTVGEIVEQGHALYEVDGSPVVLLHGETPAYRNLEQGVSGVDVAQLNAALVALGYGTEANLDPSSDSFGRVTAAAVKRLQADNGLDQTGLVSFGQVVFMPSDVRVTGVLATLGAPAQPGAAVLQGSATVRQVTVQLSAVQQSRVKIGDAVVITLPDNQTTAGTVATVGTVATAPPSSGNSGGGPPTIEVVVTPSDPDATGTLDQAPVQVSITTDTAEDVLVVPVTALLALASGGYAVETVDAAGVHQLLGVTVGLFDTAHGFVEVSGDGLKVGQRVVVPSS